MLEMLVIWSFLYAMVKIYSEESRKRRVRQRRLDEIHERRRLRAGASAGALSEVGDSPRPGEEHA